MGFQHFHRQVAADEDEAAFPLFAFFPGALVVTFDDHVHALHDVAVVVPGKGENALHPQDVRTLKLGRLLDPGEEFLRVEFAGAQGDALHAVRVLIMLMMVIVVMVMMIVIAVRPADRVVFVQEMRFEMENAVEIERAAVEIERAAVENLGKIDRAALRLVNDGIGIDRADRGFHRLDLFGGDEVDLVEQDYVGEGDLIARFFGILEALRQMLGVHHGHHRIEFGRLAHVLVYEEGLGDGDRVGDAGGLDEDAVEGTLALHQVL